MTDSGWLHYRDLKSRCPTCKRPAHIAKRDGTFYFVDDEYNPFVRHAPVKTTEEVFRFFANGYRREHGAEPEVIIPHSHTMIESNDHVVFFLPNKRLVQDVERLFRVSATFF